MNKLRDLSIKYSKVNERKLMSHMTHKNQDTSASHVTHKYVISETLLQSLTTAITEKMKSKPEKSNHKNIQQTYADTNTKLTIQTTNHQQHKCNIKCRVVNG